MNEERQNDLRILCSNVRSLNSSENGIKELIQDTLSDILCMQEIWMAPSYPQIEEYKLCTHARTNTQGGG